jgi:hypothetical protein
MVRFGSKRALRTTAPSAAPALQQQQQPPGRRPLLHSGVALVLALAVLVSLLLASGAGHPASGALLRSIESRYAAAARAAATDALPPLSPASAVAPPAAFPALPPEQQQQQQPAAAAPLPLPQASAPGRTLAVPPPPPLPLPAALPAATAGGGPAAAAAAPGAPRPYRGVLNPAHAVRALHWVKDPSDGVVRLRHAVPNARCPKWLQVEQNREAGAGHRLRQWSTALWVAASLPPTSRVAFAHTSLDVGVGMHGGYPGLDAFLGLRQGEAALDAPALVTPAGKGVREFPCSLDWVTDAPYAPNAAMLGKWNRRMGNPDDCNFLYTAPKDHWASDHSTATRLLHAWKYAAAAKARAGAGARLALAGSSSSSAEWDPAHVHIGVHQRLGDGLLVPEAVLARIVARYVLAELGAAAVPTRTVLHVFSEAESPSAELPALSALAGRELGPGRGTLAVFFHGAEVDFIHTVWSLSQCDFFVGSVSSMSCALQGPGPASGTLRRCLLV